MYTKEEIEIANKTSRGKGAIGPNALCIKAFTAFTDKRKDIVRGEFGNDLSYNTLSVLDYGSGKTAEHAKYLRELGWTKVDAYDFGDNFNPDIHISLKNGESYCFVIASNVLNVQSSEDMLRKTLAEINNNLSGWLICNFPKSPRKFNLTKENFENILSEFFVVEERLRGNVYICGKVRYYP